VDGGESNPRRRSTSEDSGEDPDLATPDAEQSASEEGHKQTAKWEERPFIHPGQLTVFDLFGDG
jgi:hypothetical protein